MGAEASWFDGDVAVERFAVVGIEGDELILTTDSAIERVALASLVRLRGSPGKCKYGRRDRSGWRMVIDEPLDAALAGRLPTGFSVLAPPVNRKALVLSLVAASLIVGSIGSVFFAPQLVASQMPLTVERRIGRAFDLPDGLPRCEDPAARAAIHKIINQVDPKALADGFTVEFVDSGQANAAALPGGRIVILTGLMNIATDGEAVAGVLAHEIAHVRQRHVASAMVRQLGLKSVIALMGGDLMAANAGGLLSRSFSRSAEAEADDQAMAMMQRAKVNPRSTAGVFELLAEVEGRMPEWLGDHPASAGRARKFAASYQQGAGYRAILTLDEEAALFNICRSPGTSWSAQ
jgi:Zn-dependent protease with chaperone function